MNLSGSRILVGIGGGIAAYKAAHVVRGLVASGADVHVVPTAASLEFVGAATWEALSHHPVRTGVFEDVDQVAHVRAGQEADLVLILPATADLLARLRIGRADDLLTASALVTRAPVVIAPAMHTEMWEHPATAANVAVLRERGALVLEPADGRLTGPDSGPGRLPEPEAILAAVAAVAAAPRDGRGIRQDLAGSLVLITAGGTSEDIDPVRYLTNHSSGKQGWALAHAALVRGAEVTLIAAGVPLETPPGARRIDVRSAADLADAVAAELPGADVLIMAAAVADFTPSSREAVKIKKTGDESEDAPAIALRRTVDILRTAVTDRDRRRDTDPTASAQIIVGFAAETGDPGTPALQHAQEKARRKGADLLVFNDVSGDVFGAEETVVSILDGDGTELAAAHGKKITVAHAVIDQVSTHHGDVPWAT